MKTVSRQGATEPRPVAESEWIGAGICDGCMQQKPDLCVVNAAPVLAGACMCQECLCNPMESTR